MPKVLSNDHHELKDFISAARPFVRSPYNYDVKAASDEVALITPEPSLAQQQFKDDSDPNVIMAKFARTQDHSLLQVRSPQYGDFTGIGDYQSALNAVIAAEEGFMELDAKIRSRFNNDPGQLLAFLSDGRNREEAISLGLIDAPAEPDLSPAAARAPKSASKAAGGKSARPLKASVQASNEADGGEEGDE